jgi:hypothetical protein
MLQDGQLIRVIAYVVQKPLDQARGNVRTTDRNGSFDDLGQLVPCQARDQVLAAVQGLGQPAELGADAEVIRAHGEYDENRYIILRSPQQELDEGGSRIAPSVFRSSRLEPEQFLELVDNDEQIVVTLGATGCLDQAHAAAADDLSGLLQGLSEAADRVVAWAEQGYPPVRPCPGHMTAVQGRQQTRPDQ